MCDLQHKEPLQIPIADLTEVLGEAIQGQTAPLSTPARSASEICNGSACWISHT